MTPAKVIRAPEWYCGAKNRQMPGTCRLRAGFGTDHVGTGRCRKHGGKTKGQRIKAHREEALDFVRGQMGNETPLDPLDALLQAVRLASGAVTYWRVRLIPYPAGEAPAGLVSGLNDAVDRQARVAKAALDGKVAEKLVQITERMAERITLAAEDALAALELDLDARTRFTEIFAARLMALEDDRQAVPEDRHLAA